MLSAADCGAARTPNKWVVDGADPYRLTFLSSLFFLLFSLHPLPVRYKSLFDLSIKQRFLCLSSQLKQKETRGGLSVRVFLHRIDIKLQNENIVIGYNIPNSFREYWFDLRTNP